MKQVIIFSLAVFLLSACTKKNENAKLDPIFHPTDMLFEDFGLERFSQRIPDAPFTTGPATFNVKKSGMSWTGFAISNRNYRSFVQLESSLDSTKYSVYAGAAPNATGTFLVVHPKDDDATVTFDRPLTVEKILVAPTTWLYQTMMYGTGTTISGKLLKHGLPLQGY